MAIILETKPEDIVSKLENQSQTKESELSWYTQLQKESIETEDLERKENDGILGMRKRWANWVLFLIIVIVIFDIVLIIFIGLGWWQFTDPSIVIAVITDNFLKIMGLGYLITREIFKKIYH